MSKSLNKIKIKENGVEIGYTAHLPVDDEFKNLDYTIKSNIKPHLLFFQAFQKMKKHAIGYMELTTFKQIEESVLSKYVVNSIKIFEDMEDVKLEIVITKTLSNGKSVSMKTPMLGIYDSSYSEHVDLAACFEDLQAEAFEFLEGKNGETQLMLDFKAA
jgi:hypothetical protein